MINIKPSMILDAICYLEKGIYFSQKQWMSKEQIKMIEELNRINIGLIHKCLNMSTVSLIVSTFYNNENLDLYNLDDLLNVFENINLVDKVVKERISNDFQKKYVYPTLDWLRQEYAEIYIKNINLLKQNQFDLYWKKEIYPKVLDNIKKKYLALQKVNVKALIANVCALKNISKLGDINIYVSFMSSPTAFTLYNGYLDNTLGIRLDNMLAHELMHGFASDELIMQYRTFMESSDYLKQCYKFLIDEMKSGEEEELVMSAEYYLMYLNGIPKLDIYKYVKTNYGYNLPLSIVLFELAINEKNRIIDYNQWLLNKFSKKEIPEITKDGITALLG
ncbi:MAG TPA: hypothetical protein PLR16_03495 [Bacilli bacterium]|nr:MAG: hypothetical protein BWY97_00903 [Tenericutes bacterium ADurb.BinA124]HNZ50511.1 hypothetical protein [Bacilli bacterium]HPX84330.1 hypothetical protein [Bacilli bacterium]